MWQRGKARVVRLTPLAEADLEDIWAYIFEQWSLAQAEQYVGEIVAAFNRLARGEWVGAVRGEPYRRYLVSFHAVFYRETTDALDVACVRHQRMDVGSHLSQY
ncbi:type II toxin-antitoxin system RelE/ParE family toxin [Burkholderia glumae]|uniref:type II toxin-antitoxin system RelE/ParE family toxin n=1 Tax=Burkholderia glumae TaxID=337 RepID=UPI00214F983E|nr:type II toxin-antitoxin system RelE/ParE family toxin [Burkholderia glumae]